MEIDMMDWKVVNDRGVDMIDSDISYMEIALLIWKSE